MFYDNLKAICDKLNLKLTPIVAECGGAKGSISNWKNGASPNSDIVAKLAVRLNVSTDYLITGKEKSSPTDNLSADEQELLTYFKKLNPLYKSRVIGKAEALSEVIADKQKELLKNIQTNRDPIRKLYIEFYDLPVSAGTGIYLDNSDCDMLEVEENELTVEANFALRIQGNSMEPKFSDGDIILIRTQPNVEIGEIGIFILNNEGLVKKFEGDRLVSLNKSYNDIVFEEYDDICCKGKVIGKL